MERGTVSFKAPGFPVQNNIPPASFRSTTCTAECAYKRIESGFGRVARPQKSGARKREFPNDNLHRKCHLQNLRVVHDLPRSCNFYPTLPRTCQCSEGHLRVLRTKIKTRKWQRPSSSSDFFFNYPSQSPVRLFRKAKTEQQSEEKEVHFGHNFLFSQPLLKNHGMNDESQGS